jgi:hypothetical protein
MGEETPVGIFKDTQLCAHVTCFQRNEIVNFRQASDYLVSYMLQRPARQLLEQQHRCVKCA